MRTASKKINPFIRWAFFLFLALLAVYIPLKVHIARSEDPRGGRPGPVSLSIFMTYELDGHGEPCG